MPTQSRLLQQAAAAERAARRRPDPRERTDPNIKLIKYWITPSRAAGPGRIQHRHLRDVHAGRSEDRHVQHPMNAAASMKPRKQRGEGVGFLLQPSTVHVSRLRSRARPSSPPTRRQRPRRQQRRLTRRAHRHRRWPRRARRQRLRQRPMRRPRPPRQQAPRHRRRSRRPPLSPHRAPPAPAREVGDGADHRSLHRAAHRSGPRLSDLLRRAAQRLDRDRAASHRLVPRPHRGRQGRLGQPAAARDDAHGRGRTKELP